MTRAAWILAIVAAVVFLSSGPGTRLGWFGYGIGLRLFALTLPIASLALLLALIAVARAKHFTPMSILAVGISAVLVIVTGWHIAVALRTAPIHDITTDSNDPPSLVAAVALRGPHTNPVVYGGSKIAEWQKRFYPDIAAVVLPDVIPADAFVRAMRAASSEGLTIIATEPAEGRIEATATTGWFGFKDDVVIRVRPDGHGSRIDIRSVSRVGRGDAGENARRVRALLRLMRQGGSPP
jgi:hypothetical protein